MAVGLEYADSVVSTVNQELDPQRAIPEKAGYKTEVR
jgi:hypothetical protein